MVALSNEDDELVSSYVEKHNLQVRVASGHRAEGPFAVGGGIPRSYLIGADGKVAWAGSPYSLNKGKIKDALKKAKKSSGSYMAFQPTGEYSDSSVTKLVEKVQQGELGKTWKSALSLHEKSEAGTVQTEIKSLIDEIQGHANLLAQQAEAFITRRDMVKGTGILEALQSECRGLPFADTMANRIKEIENDDELNLEWAADKDLNKLRQAAAKKGWKRNLKKLHSLADKHQGTAAAKKAKRLIRMINDK